MASAFCLYTFLLPIVISSSPTSILPHPAAGLLGTTCCTTSAPWFASEKTIPTPQSALRCRIVSPWFPEQHPNCDIAHMLSLGQKSHQGASSCPLTAFSLSGTGTGRVYADVGFWKAARGWEAARGWGAAGPSGAMLPVLELVLSGAASSEGTGE
eukprot:CAMPEP_0169447210 /NCGR_PEP_ID=MMETSP1042-20121227/11398_1 /TAXON_ID=464988 /ORGANISM="Hemiselmis andersenii, Strain CCMP1180" /LENGTH=154 /DNA_ID=CAMNT_0009558751 /DNA_START=318 /DNA_END=782 /DNA_ORIENTATION=+